MNTIKRIWVLFNSTQKKQSISLLFFIILLALIQASGAGAILPIVSMLIQPDLFMQHPIGQMLFQMSGTKTVGDFTVFLLICYGALYISMQLGNSYLNYRQYKFVYDYQLSIATKMLRGYLHKDYQFFIRQNSAVLLRNVITESRCYTCTFVYYILYLLSNATIGATLFLVLLFVAPKLTLAISLASICAYRLGIKKVQSTLKEWAEERNVRSSQMNLVAHQCLAGAKEIKVHGCEDKYIQEYYSEALPYEWLSTKYHTVNSSIPHLISAAVFCVVIAALAILSSTGVNITQFLPLLALLGVGFSRVLPLALNMFNAVFTLRFYWESFETVSEAMKDLRSQQESTLSPPLSLPFQNVITLDKCFYKYPDSTGEALRDVSLSIAKGSKCALVGESGSGKSTAVDILLGLMRPQSGAVRIDGVELSEDNVRAWRDKIGYVSQSTFILDATLEQNIAFGAPANVIDQCNLERAIRLACLDKLVKGLPDGVKTSLGDRGIRISGGEMQRVGIARALYRNPEILILDEPTSSLDSITEKQIIDDVLALDKAMTIVIITHRLASVRFCNTLYLLDKGSVVGSGDYDSLLETCPAFKSMDEATR